MSDIKFFACQTAECAIRWLNVSINVCLESCANGNGGCHNKRKCTNTAGGTTCGKCAAGWTDDGPKGCKGLWLLLNCPSGVCHSQHISARVCYFDIFFQTTGCEFSYIRIPVSLDVNECLKSNGGCHSKRKCINFDGSMKCGDCGAGFANDGAKGCKGLWRLINWSAVLSTHLRKVGFSFPQYMLTASPILSLKNSNRFSFMPVDLQQR